VRIAASLELGRRVAMATIEFGDTVCVEDLGPFLATRYGDAVQEHFGAAFLNARRGMIALRELCVGTLNSALVSPREVLRSALELHAAGIIAYHNHPSGDPSPSVEDLTVTMKLRNAAKNMDIDFIDHVIVAKRRYYSMAKHGHF
jgi:DNA repair protein RadC